MTARVLVFGPFTNAVGDRSVEVRLLDQETVTAAQVLDLLGRQHPALRAMLKHARLAVNCSMASDATVIRPDDELALIGMVSGG